jgi:hypothetical protein
MEKLPRPIAFITNALRKLQQTASSNTTDDAIGINVHGPVGDHQYPLLLLVAFVDLWGTKTQI